MADEVKRAQLKMAHSLRAQFNYNVGLDRIDHRFDVIEPALEKIALEATQGQLPEFIPTDYDADTNVK